MRMYGFLKNPSPVGGRTAPVCPVLPREARREETCVCLYENPEALFCRVDFRCGAPDKGLDLRSKEPDRRGWIAISNCLPGGPLSPVPAKDRDSRRPPRGCYEILRDGEWRDITP